MISEGVLLLPCFPSFSKDTLMKWRAAVPAEEIRDKLVMEECPYQELPKTAFRDMIAHCMWC
jgi:hypothetical protein